MNGLNAGDYLAKAGSNYNDLNSLNDIKRAGRERDPESLRKVAQQFEAMFVQMMLKTMRQTNEIFGKDNFLNSSEANFYQQMLDSQMSINLSGGRGMGLADAFYQQLNGQYQFEKTTPAGVSEPFSLDQAKQRLADIGRLNWQDITASSPHAGIDLDAMRVKMAAAAEARQAYLEGGQRSSGPQLPASSKAMADSIEEFITQLAPAATRAANYLGVAPKALVAQAALETGWGQHVIHDAAGNSSHNLFNIKALGKQPSVQVDTLEYRGGQPVMEQAKFRKYNNLAESFADYARLLKTSPRYSQALEQGRDSGAFVEQLQAAGYATDPKYAEKIKQIMQRREFNLMP